MLRACGLQHSIKTFSMHSHSIPTRPAHWINSFAHVTAFSNALEVATWKEPPFGIEYMQGKPCAYEPFTCLSQPEHEIPVIIDTEASTSLTPVIGDFLGDLEPAPMNEITGLTATTRVVGKGTVKWAIRDYWNVV
jgi:hypothetical protein